MSLAVVPSVPPFRLARAADGRLVFTHADGTTVDGVVPVRAFPVTGPDDGVALVDGEGRELVWIERLDALPAPVRTLVEETLAAREFLPEILRIVSVSHDETPCEWVVETDRGRTAFRLEGEDDIRRLGATMLLVTDAAGVEYLVRNPMTLDAASRRLLDRFL